MKKLLCFAMSAILLTACGKTKDAQYFYQHPEEIDAVAQECEKKIEPIETEAEMLKLKEDKLCRNAMLGSLAVRLGDLKKAAMAESERGWSAYIDTHLKRLKRDEIGNKFLDEIDAFSSKEAIEKIREQFEYCVGITHFAMDDNKTCQRARDALKAKKEALNQEGNNLLDEIETLPAKEIIEQIKKEFAHCKGIINYFGDEGTSCQRAKELFNAKEKELGFRY